MPHSASSQISCSSRPTKWHFWGIFRRLTSLTLLLVCFAGAASATVTTPSFPAAADQGSDPTYPIFLPRIAAPALSKTAPAVGTNPEVGYLHNFDSVAQTVTDRLLVPSVESAPMTDPFASPSSRSERDRPARSDSPSTLWLGLTSTPGTINSALSFTASQLQIVATYIANGGDDPYRSHAHLSNAGIKFASLAPVPEIEAIYPVISLLTAIVCIRLLRRQRSVQVQAIRILKR
jgi:hypothetical protein